MVSANPAQTYRDYRKQALYILWRLLTDTESENRSYHPEGEEDLAVFDSSGQLVEAVQVKDHASPLTLSDLKPASAGGFFARMKRRRQAHPSCRHVLATFGPVGVELDGAIAGAGPHRKAAAAKIHQSNSAITESEAEQLRADLKGNITRPEEAHLRAGVLASLADTIAGLHADTAVELLLYRVFEASEQCRTLTRSSVLQQLQRIGDYLSVLGDHAAEWMTTLRPLSAVALADDDERERLRHEYKLGVQARWHHIAAADSARPHRLADLHEKMTQHAAVVVRGATPAGFRSLVLPPNVVCTPRTRLRYQQLGRAILKNSRGCYVAKLCGLTPAPFGQAQRPTTVAPLGGQIATAVVSRDTTPHLRSWQAPGSRRKPTSPRIVGVPSVYRQCARRRPAIVSEGKAPAIC